MTIPYFPVPLRVMQTGIGSSDVLKLSKNPNKNGTNSMVAMQTRIIYLTCGFLLENLLFHICYCNWNSGFYYIVPIFIQHWLPDWEKSVGTDPDWEPAVENDQWWMATYKKVALLGWHGFRPTKETIYQMPTCKTSGIYVKNAFCYQVASVTL